MLMTRRLLCACGLALVLGAPGPAGAGEVRLAIKDGRVELVARDATLREILLEWERVGGTRIVNRDRVPGTRFNLDLANVTEEQALTTLLRPIAGYLASRRLGSEGGSSAFSRIPGEASPVTYAASPTPSAAGPSGGGPSIGRPGAQRRVLPDGRVVTVMDDQRMDEPDDPDELRPGGNPPSMSRPPFNAPPRMQQEQAGGEAPEPVLQPGRVAPTMSTAPTVPPTIGKPGALPAAKPGASPTPPIKPPGD
jgi:hypothetical protein